MNVQAFLIVFALACIADYLKDIRDELRKRR